MNRDLSDWREDYQLSELVEENCEKNPFNQFKNWLSDAVNAKLKEPNAMVLSTVNASGQPSQRIVLLKEWDENGLIFYTNYGSNKANEIAQNSQVSLLFPWIMMERQIIIKGKIAKISIEKSKEYFYKRPKGSQLGALVSKQSEQLDGREELEARYVELAIKFKNEPVPFPENWGGYQIIPDSFEFWQGRSSRLHDRIKYEQKNGSWEMVRLSP